MSTEKKMFKVMTDDGQILDASRDAIFMSIVLKDMCEDIDVSDVPIPVGNHVTAEVMQKVIQFCEYHASHPEINMDYTKEREINDPWDIDFCNMPIDLKVNTTLAANYLNVKPLLNLLSLSMALMIRGKTPEEIRQIMGTHIKNDEDTTQ